jgi:hypothetical protein
VVPRISNQRCGTQNIESRLWYPEYRINAVVPRISNQRCGTQNIESTLWYPEYQINAVVPRISNQRCGTQNIESTLWYPEYRINAVVPRILNQRCGTQNIESRLWYPEYRIKAVVPRISNQRCGTQNIESTLWYPEYRINAVVSKLSDLCCGILAEGKCTYVVDPSCPFLHSSCLVELTVARHTLSHNLHPLTQIPHCIPLGPCVLFNMEQALDLLPSNKEHSLKMTCLLYARQSRGSDQMNNACCWFIQ